MIFSVETIAEKDSVLIVSKINHSFLSTLKTELATRGCEVFFSSEIPKNTSKFQYCFIVNQEPKKSLAIKNTVVIFINQKNRAEKLFSQKFTSLKVVNVTGNLINKEHVDKILWFSFSTSKEKYLSFAVNTIVKTKHHDVLNWQHKLISLLTPKRFVLSIIVLIIFIHISFIPFYVISSINLYDIYQSLSQEQISLAKQKVQSGHKYFIVSKNMYALVRPTYAIFSLSLIPDRFMDINDKSYNLLSDSINVIENIQNITKSFLTKNKSNEEVVYLKLRIENVKNRLSSIEENLAVLQNKLPDYLLKNNVLKQKIANLVDGVAKIRALLKYSNILFAENSEHKYLLVFANNMELRPGGGFIGSFALLTVKNFTLSDLKIYDVYDADGQLTAHIEPPMPIKKYLDMPHLFLRDSNFSPDFSENYTLSKFFLEKELNLTDISGSVVITTSAIESLLGAYGDIYLPDFNETINQRNFYLKTQMHAENNFFPGSTQKKTYLSSLVKQLLINLENVSSKQILMELKKSLDEKQIAVIVENNDIQKIIDSLYWSGKVIKSSYATETKNYIVDYLFPYDMNVGPNKVNYFIKRSLSQKIIINSDGSINNVFSIRFNNEATLGGFPGGVYRNYFQLYLPLNTQVNKITNNGVLVEDYQIENDKFTKLGFFLQIEPQKNSEIKIFYRLPTNLKIGKGIYQLIVQKQIGSSNSDFAFELKLPSNVYILNQNFSPLVKDKEIVYNTNLSADKIFFVELKRE